jgi:hypothetical protein
MAQAHPAVRILEVSAANARAAAAAAHNLTSITISHVDSVKAAEQRLAEGWDALFIDLDLEGGFELLERLGRTPGAPRLVAEASKGVGRHTLEYTLLLAELRGAVIALPKGMDFYEMTSACMELVSRSQADCEYRRNLDHELGSWAAAPSVASDIRLKGA